MKLDFDRGTLLVQCTPRQHNFLRRTGLAWDDRVDAFRWPAYRYAELCAALKQSGFHFYDAIQADKNTHDVTLRAGVEAGVTPQHERNNHNVTLGAEVKVGVTSQHERANHDVTLRAEVDDGIQTGAGRSATLPAVSTEISTDLRPYQQAALGAWQAMGQRGVVVLPTGSGKTHVAMAAILLTGLPALCLVPTRILLEQWRTFLQSRVCESVGVIGDGEYEVQRITVCTFESAYRHMSRIGHRFELMVLDEVHHFGSGIRDEALEMCTAPARLGLTATPPNHPGSRERLRRLVGPVAYEMQVGDLTGRYLAEFELRTMTLDLTAKERASYEQDMEKFRPLCRSFFRARPGAHWSDFVRAISESDEGRLALRAWRRAQVLLAFTQAKSQVVEALLQRHRDNKTLVFTSNNETAYAIARQHLIMPLTCDITRKERASVLASFREGGLRALVSARVLNEGIDVPDADVAVIVGGAHGEREHVQRVGRLLRPSAGKRAIIYELVNRDTSETRQADRRRRALGSRSHAAVPAVR